jgi:hypothetical protein
MWEREVKLLSSPADAGEGKISPSSPALLPEGEGRIIAEGEGDYSFFSL